MLMSGPGRLPTLAQITDPQSIPASTRGWLNTTQQEASESDGGREREKEIFKCALYLPPPRVRLFRLFRSHPASLSVTPPPPHLHHIALRAEVSLNLLLVAVVNSLTLSVHLLERTQIVFGVFLWTNSRSTADLSSVVNPVSACIF